MLRKMILAVVSAALAIFVFGFGLAGITDVDPGEAAIPIKKLGENKGMQDYTYDTGLHWVNPVTYDVVIYDVKWKENLIEDIPSQTADGQPVLVDLSLSTAIEDSKAPLLHEKIGRNWFDERVYPLLFSSVRNLVPLEESDAVYTAEGRQVIQDSIQERLDTILNPFGILTVVNLRAVDFQNADFVRTIEEKAKEAQNVQIQERQAEAMVFTANKMAEEARGKKEARVQAAEAMKEELRLEGEGNQLRDEATAAGNLALALAEAEGKEALVNAYAGDPSIVAQIEWARNVGPNVKVYGFPTGAQGTTSLMDVNGVLKGALNGGKQ